MLYFLLGGCAAFLAAAAFTSFLISRKVHTAGDCKYLLVLGTTVNGTSPSIMLSERIRTAYEYLIAHPDAICIPTGGKNPDADIPEAQCIANELMAMGIGEDRIWIEPKADSTRENLLFSLDRIEANTGTRPNEIGILTSDFHVFRVQMMARRLGLSATAVPSKSAHTIFYYPAFLREIIAVWYYYLFKKA